MKKIPSFTINHELLDRGIYLSRIDTTPSGDILSTFDIRMTQPNRQKAIAPATLHTIEHLAATYLRNHPQWADKIVYWGPMGCCTGNYLILSGAYTSAEIVPLITDTFRFIADFQGQVPGATARDCGNYTFMDLEDARTQARIYLQEVLLNLKESNLNYPQ